MERVEPVPAGIIEDAVVVGCAAFREDANTNPPARRPAEILERLPNRAPVNGGIDGGPRPPLPNRLEWFCFPDGDVAPVRRRRRPPDSVHWFTLHDERTRPLRGCVLTCWRRCATQSNQDTEKALWVPTALCVLSCDPARGAGASVFDMALAPSSTSTCAVGGLSRSPGGKVKSNPRHPPLSAREDATHAALPTDARDPRA